MRFLFFIIFSFLYGSQFLTAQRLPIQALEAKMPSMTLPGGAVTAVAQTKDGFLWLTAYGAGLYRYDGKDLRAIPLPENASPSPHTILQDEQGFLWLGLNYTRQGQPQGPTVLVSTYPLDGGPLPPDFGFTDTIGTAKLPAGNVSYLSLDNVGNVWTAIDSTVYRIGYDGEHLTPQLITATTPSLLRGRIGQVIGQSPTTFWMSINGEAGAYRLRYDEANESFELLDSLAMTITANIRQFPDDEGVWTMPISNGLAYYPPPNESGVRPEPIFHPLGGRVKFVELLDDTTVVAGVQGTGIVLLDRYTAAIVATYGVDDGLPSNVPFCFMRDSFNNVWLGLLNGLYRMPSDFRAFASYDNEPLGDFPALLREASINFTQANIVRQLGDGRTDTVVLAGASNGLAVIPKSGQPFVLTEGDGIPFPLILTANQDRRGGIYLSGTTRNGVYLAPPGVDFPSQTSSQPLPGFAPGYRAYTYSSGGIMIPYITTLADGTETLWGTAGGYLRVLVDKTSYVTFFPESGYNTGSTTGYARMNPSGHLVVVTSKDIFRSLRPITHDYLYGFIQPAYRRPDAAAYEVKEPSFEPVAIVHEGDTLRGALRGEMIDGELWVAYPGKVVVLNGDDLSIRGVFDTEDKVYHVADIAGANGSVWLSSANSIWEVDAASLTTKRRIFKYDGVIDIGNWSPVGMSVDEHTGDLYQAKVNGLQIIRPAYERPDSFDLVTRITEASYSEDNWGKNELNISYSLLAFRDDHELTPYRTKLVGYDEDWSEDRLERSIRYTNLSAFLFPKTYEFRVMGMDGKGDYYENDLPYTVSVAPPLYFRWWAFLIYFALLALAVRAFTRYRIREAEKAVRLEEAATIRAQRDEITAKNAQNELLLKEIHHRVKNNLETVSSLLELQSATLTDGQALAAMQAGQSRVQSMGLLHQKLYQGKNLAAIEMSDYFNNLAAGLLETYGEESRITVNVNMEPLELDVDTAVPLGLIVNELLTNTIKYAFPGADAGAVEVNLSKAGTNDYLLVVADNGVGKDFKAGPTGTGFGTRLVQLLTRQLGGELRETNDEGLRTELTFKTTPMAGF